VSVREQHAAIAAALTKRQLARLEQAARDGGVPWGWAAGSFCRLEQLLLVRCEGIGAGHTKRHRAVATEFGINVLGAAQKGGGA
jgi:hypothetical protein